MIILPSFPLLLILLPLCTLVPSHPFGGSLGDGGGLDGISNDVETLGVRIQLQPICMKTKCFFSILKNNVHAQTT